ncbi:glutamyl-tRNA reductase [uncultured Actinomyces sp.]|mgnify:FL=1|uniref:glutamyl-tRNA reductase n=1 Tax=uncultured Actinomyces sp. TaxID=249061 RepID=UPI0026714AA0|nr:glutamyl-tRNA reductase [uncultured Actinomyces sp.]
MTIHVLSADHRYTPLDDIARLSSADDLGPTLMRSLPHARGVMVLRTCNRVTIYVDTPASADPRALKDAVERELATATRTPRADVRLRHLWGRDGLVDLFATASGLESMVVGEREIAGQMRRAARTAWEDGTLSCDLGRAAERASAASRRVATETGLAGAGRSVVAVGLDMAAAHLGPWEATRVLIVGTGAYAGATVSTLNALRASDVSVYSTSGRAREFAAGRGIGWVDGADLPTALTRADLVVTCRGLGSPILTRDMAAASGRTVVLDLALMRDTDDSVGSLPNVTLIDLPTIQASVPAADADALNHARAIIDEEVSSFERGLGARSMDPVVRHLRSRVFRVVEEEIDRLGDAPLSTDDAARALRHLAARLIHNPTVLARRAGEESQQERYLEALGVVLGIDEATLACGDNAGAHAFSPDNRGLHPHTVTPTVANLFQK